jgi:hypothetical protein
LAEAVDMGVISFPSPRPSPVGEGLGEGKICAYRPPGVRLRLSARESLPLE